MCNRCVWGAGQWRSLSLGRGLPGADCAYACFNHGWRVQRHLIHVTLTSAYIGNCDCQLRGAFEGSISFQGTMSIAAANGAGDTLKVSLYRKVNSMMARIYHRATGEVCLHVWNPLQGTMGGLPVEKSAISTPSAVSEEM